MKSVFLLKSILANIASASSTSGKTMELDRDRYVCFVDLCKRGNSGCREGEGRGEQGSKGKRRVWGRGGASLEGRTNSATLEWLGRAVVVHHAAFGFALGGEEQVAEFGHL